MLRKPTLLLGPASLLAALALLLAAEPASAAQKMTITDLNQAGFRVTAPSDSKIESCYGTGYDASGMEVAQGFMLGVGLSGKWADLYWEEKLGTIASASVECDLRTKVVTHLRKWHWFRKVRPGVREIRRDRSGKCRFSESFGALTIAARGADYCRATYRFRRPPSDARRVTRSITGERSSTDAPGTGTIRKRIVGRKGSVTVTGRRAYVVKGIWVRYQSRRMVDYVDDEGYGEGQV